MKTRPITPKLHGIIDYGFTALQWLAPSLLKLNKKAQWLYAVLGTNLLVYNAVTDTPVGIKKELSFPVHGTVDRVNVGLLAMLTLYSGIRKDKRALIFHTAFVSLAALNILLTDWNADPKEDSL